MENKELMITLWNHCYHRCFFCYNRGYYDFPLDLKKHIKNCLNLLKSENIKEYGCIRLVGGELFDGFIDDFDIKKEFLEILDQLEYLINNSTIKKVNVVTNLMYSDKSILCYVLNRFKGKITLSTSYDEFGRFNSTSDKLTWWKNIRFLQSNYPDLEIDVGINTTQPFIETIDKKWLDEFQEKLGKYTINFNELFAGIDNKSKKTCEYKDYFPKRRDFIQFLQKLKQWNYLNTIVGTKDTKLIHYVFDETGIAKLKDTECLQNQGYIDSEAKMRDDIKRIIDADR